MAAARGSAEVTGISSFATISDMITRRSFSPTGLTRYLIAAWRAG